MSRFLSDRYKNIEPYTPGEQPKNTALIKLNTNESPFPPSPEVIRALNNTEVSKLNLYSDPETKEITDAVASVFNVSPSQVIMGNGSDEILAFTFEAFCDDTHRPSFPDITYGFYPVFCELFSLSPNIIPLKEDLTVNISDYFNCTGPVFIANPNAPTGISLKLKDIEEILTHNRDNIVLIDEAYVDFGGETALPLIKKYDNLIVCRTFSKSRNLAGARLGFAIGNEQLITDLKKMKFSFNPYNLNRLSIIAGKEAMLDTEYFEECRNKIIATRKRTVLELQKRNFIIPESKANFIFAKHSSIDGTYYYKKLREKNILVRHFDVERIKDYVRITIGSDSQMDALIKATDEILGCK